MLNPIFISSTAYLLWQFIIEQSVMNAGSVCVSSDAMIVVRCFSLFQFCINAFLRGKNSCCFSFSVLVWEYRDFKGS